MAVTRERPGPKEATVSADPEQSITGPGWGTLAVTYYPGDRTLHVKQWRLRLANADELGVFLRRQLGEPAEEEIVAVVRNGTVSGFQTQIGSPTDSTDTASATIAMAWVPPSDTGFVQLWYVATDFATDVDHHLTNHLHAPDDEQLIPIGLDDNGEVIPPAVISKPSGRSN